MRRLLATLALLLLCLTTVSSQQYLGTPGLVHVPTADMDTVGVARVGAHYVPKEMVPDMMKCDGEKFNTFTNYLSLTPFRWIEIAYGYTLWKFHRNLDPSQKTGFYAKDRYFSLRLQPLREARWWPSIVVGANDAWGSREDGTSGSNFYRNYYMAASKHFDVNGWRLGAHLAYRHWKLESNSRWNGVVGGATVQPAFCPQLRLMAEWDGTEANLGADCRIFKYFLLQCGLIDCRHPHAGLSLYLPLL